jgi:hypothetical protein
LGGGDNLRFFAGGGSEANGSLRLTVLSKSSERKKKSLEGFEIFIDRGDFEIALMLGLGFSDVFAPEEGLDIIVLECGLAAGMGSGRATSSSEERVSQSSFFSLGASYMGVFEWTDDFGGTGMSVVFETLAGRRSGLDTRSITTGIVVAV